LPYISFFSAISSPLFVYFDRWLWTDLEAVSAANALAVIRDFGRMVAVGINSAGRQDQDVNRTDAVAAQTAPLADFLENLHLRHQLLLSEPAVRSRTSRSDRVMNRSV
jgi:hypothetical protein